MGQQGAMWTRIANDRESWRTLAEGYFLQWKDTASNRIEQVERSAFRVWGIRSSLPALTVESLE